MGVQDQTTPIHRSGAGQILKTKSMTYVPSDPSASMHYMGGPVVDQRDQTLEMHPNEAYGGEMPATNVYQTGGYWLTGTAMMNGVYQSDELADVVFDPLEELVWCISKMGQLTAFYSVSLERYITTTVPVMPTLEDGSQFGELKQVYPSQRATEHSVYVLASNAIHAYTKCGRSFACAMDEHMLDLECMAVTGSTGATPGAGAMWTGKEGDYSRIFLGGLQPTLLELDCLERWGEVIRTTDVGFGGSVVLRSFSYGLCAGNTHGKVLVIDPRTTNGIVRELDAHTGEISDITVVSHGYTLVTCGWSRLGDAGLRVDRMLKVYDLRSGRGQLPLSASLDPCYARFFPGCSDRLLAASQGGTFQTIQWGKRAYSPDDLSQLWPSYDRLAAMDLSNNGNCVVFGTETGQIQLYLRDVDTCQFNVAPLATEFASPLAESLWPTNNLSSQPVAPSYPLSLWDDPSNPLYGTNLMTMAKGAAEAVELQLLAASLHQPAATAGDNLRTADAVDLVERRKAEAANEAMLFAHKPVDYDDHRFAFSSVPFPPRPSALLTGDGERLGGSVRTPSLPNALGKLPTESEGTCSDWPEEMCRPQPRKMLPVDPELIVGANPKRAVRKPSHWGNVWHPYTLDSTMEEREDETMGRFVPSVVVQPVEEIPLEA